MKKEPGRGTLSTLTQPVSSIFMNRFIDFRLPIPITIKRNHKTNFLVILESCSCFQSSRTCPLHMMKKHYVLFKGFVHFCILMVFFRSSFWSYHITPVYFIVKYNLLYFKNPCDFFITNKFCSHILCKLCIVNFCGSLNQLKFQCFYMKIYLFILYTLAKVQ